MRTRTTLLFAALAPLLATAPDAQEDPPIDAPALGAASEVPS